MEHGLTAYTYHKCRCEICRTANRKYHAEWVSNRTVSEARQHGVNATYSNYGCRCEECRAAHAAYMREYNASRR